MLTGVLILLTLVASQIYWAVRIQRFLARRIESRTILWSVCSGLLIAYYIALFWNGDRLLHFPSFGPQPNPTSLGFSDALLSGMQWWLLCSFVAFLLAIPISLIASAIRALRRPQKPIARVTGDRRIVHPRRH